MKQRGPFYFKITDGLLRIWLGNPELEDGKLLPDGEMNGEAEHVLVLDKAWIRPLIACLRAAEEEK